MSLFPGEIVYDDSNSKSLLGDGQVVITNGERRLLSRLPPPPNVDKSAFSISFSKAGFQKIPRNEYDARIDEQERLLSRVSDSQNFPPHDQDGLPTCWGNGPAHAVTTLRVQNGLPYVEMSACSVCVPISGGHSGGYEGNALEYAAKHGFVSSTLWPNNSTNRALMNDPECQADRELHKALEWVDCEDDFEAYATIALLSVPGAVAYNDWRHVVSSADLVRIEAGSYGLRIRNNWGPWGAKNRFGFYGYAVFREGAKSHGCPDSGFGIRSVTSSVK